MAATIKDYFKWLYSHSKGVRRRIFLNIVLSGISILLNLFFIYLCKKLVDIATGVFDGSIWLYTSIVLIVILLRLVVNALNTRLESLTSSKMNFIIRSRIYSDILQSEWFGKDKYHSGDTLNRLETDVSTVTSVICSDSPQIFSTLFQLVAALAFMCTMDWRLALILIIITPFFVGLSKVFYSRLRTMTRNIRDTESKVQSHLQESIQHRVVIRSMENEDMMESRLENLQNEEYSQVKERTKLNIIARTIVSASFQFGYIAAFLWGVFGIMHGNLTYGIMTAFLQLVGQIQRPMVNLTRQIPAFINATASIDRLMELEDSPKEESGESVMMASPLGIRVDNLTFRYPDGDRDVLKELTFDFPPLSKTAIVGETGVGKSTLIRLMLALLKPSSGTVSLYNSTESMLASPLTRCNIVYVPQGNTLFSGTIRHNLMIGNPEADEEKMEWALRTAQADFVFSLPDGLDTVCGEKGSGLSEGQSQRIAIARGLLRPGNILLFDEFSSSLDPETEDRLIKNITALASGKTMIFITHRERIADFCDRELKL